MPRPSGRVDRALREHRARLTKRYRVKTATQLLALVDACGFCFAFTPSKADSPIPACFDHLETRSTDRKWGWMWGWKDELPQEKKLYYGKLLGRKPTFVSMKLLPAFYATFGRAGEADDHLDDVRAGRLTDLARRVIEFLAQNGETQSKRLRTALGITSDEGKRDYLRAMEDVQQTMYVARVRAVGEGREDYNYTYDVFTRRYPETVRAAEKLSSAAATETLLMRLIELGGGASIAQAKRLFDWSDEVTRGAASRLVTRRAAIDLDGMLVLPTIAKVAA